jgi:hypothetical protein
MKDYQDISSSLGPGLPDFSWPKHTKTGKIYPMTTNYTKLIQNIPNGYKIYQHFPFQGSPKHTKKFFVMKINHLATLFFFFFFAVGVGKPGYM